MNYWATTRLVLTGPASDLLELSFRCIRHQRLDVSGEEEFDFEALLPMPSEIVATLDDRSEAARELAKKKTGYANEKEWTWANWGMNCNASSTDVHSSTCNRFDVTFETPWGCPEVILQGLASQYPRLTACVFTVDHDANGGFAGKIAGGNFTGSNLELSRDVLFIAHHCTEETEISDLSGAALVSSWTNWEDPILSPDDAMNFAASAAARIKSVAPTGWGAAVDFEADYRVYSEANGDWKYAKSVMQYPANLSFFEAEDRCRTDLDRALMQFIAAGLCENAFDQIDPVVSRRSWREMYSKQLTNINDALLYEWADLAANQSDIRLDMTDADALRIGILDYGTQLREQAMSHLKNQSGY